MQKTVMFLLITALIALVDMATDLYVPLLPKVAENFNINAELAGTTISVNLISLAIGGLYYGGLSDAIGRRSVILAGLSVFTLASFACGLSTSITQLLIARSFQGLGGGVAFSVGIAVVRDLYGGGAKGAAKLSLVQTVVSVSPGLAQCIGGFIGYYYGWKNIFYLLALMGILLLGILIFFGTETLPPEKRRVTFDKGFRNEYMYLFSQTIFLNYALIQILILGIMWGEFAFLPLLFINFYKVSPPEYGMYFSVIVAVYVLGTVLNQRLVYHIPLKKLVFIGLLGFITSSIFIGIGQMQNMLTPWLIVLLKIPESLGFSLVFGNAATLSLNEISHNRIGSASAFIGSSELFAGALCISFLGLFTADTTYPLVLLMGAISTIALCVLLKTADLSENSLN